MSSFSSFVDRHPVAYNLVQGFTLFTVADVVAQRISTATMGGMPGVSVKRLAGAGIFGCVYSGFIISQWIRLLDYLIPSDRLDEKVAAKVAANMLMFGLLGNSCNIYIRRLLMTRSFVDSWMHVRGVIVSVFLADAKLFPVADALCFSAVPVHLRPAFTGIISLAWNTYMSLVANAH